VPIVEADPNILLDDEDGHQARRRVLPSACQSISNGQGYCNIGYCWTDSDGSVYSEAITITGSNGKSNPSSVTSSNTAHIQLDPTLNTGYNGWFAKGHECPNSDTEIYTDHLYDGSMDYVTFLKFLECETCFYGIFACKNESLVNNIVSYTTSVTTRYSYCKLY
jgi:hypothetical protein